MKLWIAIRKKDMEPVKVSKHLDDLPKKGHYLVQVEVDLKP